MKRLAISESYGTITTPWDGSQFLPWVRETSLTHILTHTGSARSGRGRFQWIAGGDKLRENAPNRVLPSQPTLRTEKDIGSENPETTTVSGFFRAIFQGKIQKISFPKNDL